MRKFLAVAVFLGTAGGASAAGLRDFSKPERLAVVSHDRWTSYVVHKEDGLSVHLIRVGPGIQRNAYRLNADTVVLALHPQRLKTPKPSKEYRNVGRGDFSFSARAASAAVG